MTETKSFSKTPGFDAALAGRHAECDGGGPVAATGLGTREEFAGVLTGEYVDHGDPPWRWYLMTQLTRKPDGYPWDAVWCSEESVFAAGDGPLRVGLRPNGDRLKPGPQKPEAPR